MLTSSSNGSTSCPTNDQITGVIPMEEGTIPGSYFTNIESADDCQSLCNSNGYCQWSTYIPSSKECFLNQGTYKSNVTSGFRVQNNSNDESCPTYTTFDNTVINNGKGTDHNANSVTDCQNTCTTNSCLFYSLDGTQCTINNGISNDKYITSFVVGEGKPYKTPGR